jgi:hypothetical protein
MSTIRFARLWLCLCLCMALAGCGAREAGDGGFAARVASLPASLDGELELSVTEGDSVEAGGQGEITFGVLRVGGAEYLVEVDERTLRQAGIAVAEFKVKVRATLGAESAYVDHGYVITALARAP